VLSVPLMVLAGGLLAAQSEVNGRLAAQLGTGPRTGIAAGAISIGVSLLTLLAVSSLMPGRRREVAGIAAVFRERRLRPWEASGAVLGACFVASQGLTAPMIGVALFSIAVTAGQACSALFVDHIGLSPSGRQAVSRSRVIATALAVTAMGIGASEQLTAGVAWATVLAAAIPLATGAGLSVQQALNGRIARVVGPWAATVNNMVVGLATLTVAFAVSLLAAGSLKGMPGDADLYIGGLLGTAFVALTSWLARIHGVLVLGLSVIAGQVLAAGAIQAALPHGHATPMSLIPVALTLTGVLTALRQRAHH
jgi:transporter family-2 protein